MGEKVRVTVDFQAAGHVKECFHVSNSSAKRRQRDLWQRMVNKSETGKKRLFHSRLKRTSKMHNIQKLRVLSSLSFQ